MEMKKEKGMSLVLVMGIFVILGIIAITFLTLTTSEVKVSKYIADSKIAFHAAEAGLDYGIANVPLDLSAFPSLPDTWKVLSNQAKYKSGPPDSLPIPPEFAGKQYLIGYSIEQGLEFYNYLYDLQTSGKINRSTKEIRARVKCGPMGGGAGY